MGRFLHNINVLLFIYGIVASTLHRVLSSYHPFQTNNSFKKGKGYKGIEREKRYWTIFFTSSGIVLTVPIDKSSVLLCDMGECDCPVCEFLQDNRDLSILLRVIEVLDSKLAESEKQERRLISMFSKKENKDK